MTAPLISPSAALQHKELATLPLQQERAPQPAIGFTPELDLQLLRYLDVGDVQPWLAGPRKHLEAWAPVVNYVKSLGYALDVREPRRSLKEHMDSILDRFVAAQNKDRAASGLGSYKSISAID